MAQQPKGRAGFKNDLIWGLQGVSKAQFLCFPSHSWPSHCTGLALGVNVSAKMAAAPAFPSQLQIHWGGGSASLRPPFLPKPHPSAPLMGHTTSLTQSPHPGEPGVLEDLGPTQSAWTDCWGQMVLEEGAVMRKVKYTLSSETHT